MPTPLGQYTLAEMEDYVRREALGQFYTVDPTTGLESGTGSVYDMLISKTDIDRYLNTALVAESIKVNQFAEDAFITVAYLSVKATVTTGTGFAPSTVALPPDMLTIKEASWLPIGIGFANAKPSDWKPMPQINDQEPYRYQGSPGPAWHRDGPNMIIDQVLTQDNPNGIRLRYVKWLPMLVNPTDVIPGQLARPMQEVIILDAAIALMMDKHRNVMQEQLQRQNDSQQTLLLAASNILRPESVRQYSPYMRRSTFSGRRTRSRY